MKKLVLIGALSLGLMSFNAPIEEERIGCFSVAMFVYDLNISEGASHAAASAASNIAFANCMASER